MISDKQLSSQKVLGEPHACSPPPSLRLSATYNNHNKMYAGRYIPPAKHEAPKAEPHVATAAGTFSSSATAPYSRYIPAPKNKDAPSAAPGPAPKKIVFNVDESPVAASVAAPKKTVFADEDADGSPKKRKRNEENDDEVEDRKKDKKSKKSKRGVEDEDEAETLSKEKKSKKDRSRDNDEESDEASKVKPKKDKKKKTRESIAETDGEGDESMLVDGEENDVDEAEAKPKRDKKKKKKSKEEEPEDDTSDKVKKQHKSVLDRKEKALKKAKKSKTEVEADGTTETGQAIPEPDELHGLEPLPQPEPVVFDHHKAGYETLPPWLASPVRVQPKTKATWTDLGIGAEAAKVMANKGYKEAFAVQTAAIPLLLPSLDRQGDLVVSAATGSGKTLAYVLPMVHDISQGIVTRLRGLIVVPTRELVRQAQEACETCASAFAHGGNKRVKIGISMGSMAFKQEQATLMEEEQKYDPAGYAKYLSKRNQIVNLDDSDDEDEDEVKPAMESTTKPLPDHVIDYVSKVDILICTPGRLVEHINQTPGFTLDYVRWLVVDEADKLLAQSFQQWLDVVMDKLSVEKPGARDFFKSNKSGVRKVILSATMTRDLSLLNGLKLRRPKLIVLEGTGAENHEHSTGPEGEHALPDTLKESVIKIRDPNLKPLHLLDLLDSKHMIPMNKETEADANPEDQESDASDSSSSESDSDSEQESSSDSESDTESKPKAISTPSSNLNTTLLIFTKSNESALRLSRLLAILSPSLSPLIGVLTSTTRTATRRRTLAAFSKRKIRILVASDLVARGIDLPELDHVVNYDVPASAAAYVHRVGRTARAGRKGAAWTLVGNTEAAWFFREIGGEGKSEGKVRRVGKVERVRVGDQGEDGFGEERVKEYEAALEQLGKEAGEMRRRR